MIARVWHGTTKPEDADKYEGMLKPELLPGLSKVPGFKESFLFRREFPQETEFVTIILWESMDALRAYAGAEYQRSIVPEDRRALLVRHEEFAQHYEVVARAA